MRKLLFILAVVLVSCHEGPKKTFNKRVYKIKVNYINSSIYAVPSDTLIVTSNIVPHIRVNRAGISCLVTEEVLNPEAVNVRSFEILDIQ